MLDRYYIPLSIMRNTKEFLVNQGKAGKEAFVLWKGIKQENDHFIITGSIVPSQIAKRSSFGYSFDITEKSIVQVTKTLHQLNELGLIQVHSHPGSSAIHSKRDDALSLLGRKGALSIVLPYFGNVKFDDFSSVMVHMLTGTNKWDVLAAEKVKEMLIVMR